MSPKDKALQLKEQFSKYIYMSSLEGEKIALKDLLNDICNELINNLNDIPFVNQEEYWQEVKKEINLL